jgi:transposase
MSKKQLSHKQKWYKEVVLTKDDSVYVGLDVHKKSIHVAIWLNNGIALTYVCPPKYEPLVKDLEQLRPALKKIVYEAGPTGFGLLRALRKAKLPAAIIAPSKTPTSRSQEAKTDRLDAQALAKLSAKEMLTEIAIPTLQEEEDRQVSRLRDQLIAKRVRIRQQIKSFLLQHSIEAPKGLTRWTQSGIKQLSEMPLPKHLKFCVTRYLEEQAFIVEQILEIESELNDIFQSKRHKKQVKILRSHPGIGIVTSRQFRAEIFNPKRFATSDEIGKFVGFSPRTIETGDSHKDGRIMKTGRRRLRANLIEASWVWIGKDPKAKATFNRLLRNTGNANKAIVGIARRLTIHLWAMLCHNTYYQPSLSC